MKKEYSISDLEKLTGFSRRTVHFYIKEGLIPPTGSVGAGAKYGEEHLLRLLMIGILQKRDLKLSGIRKILDSTPLEEMKRSVEEESAKSASRGFAHLIEGAFSLRSGTGTIPSLHEEGSSHSYYLQKTDQGASSEGGFLRNKAVLQVSEPEFQNHPEDQTTNDFKEIPEKEKKADSIEIWRHIDLIDGVQMNVREDIFHKYRSLIVEMIRKFKEQ
ncbi:MAG: hypothetical protein HBSAPP04_21980 [Ignavibacteriaceae bacterium]|nr:MAG: MerR family transcriptional regulator [Chlorobiota bacterium]GJQ33359.1 MAG: hypothetical protein HBSAPP04_21980 [Ignavibacteriaceae bacterium]